MKFRNFSKKAAVIAILLLVGSSVLMAQDSFIELAFRVPVDFTIYKEESGIKNVYYQGNLGGDVAFTNMFNRVIGITANVGFDFPFAIAKQTYQTDGSSSMSSNILKDYTVFYNIDLLLGPAIAPVLNDKVAVILSPGLVFQYTGVKENTVTDSVHLLYIGAGINAVCNIMLSDIFYIKTMLAFDYYFYGINFIKNNGQASTGQGYLSQFCLTPAVGFGFRL